MFSHLVQWFRTRRARRHAEEFRLWLQTYEAARTWSKTLPCPCCKARNPKEAHFCSGCGLNLQPDPKEQNTEPHNLTERPFLAYVHQQRSDPGPQTQKYRTVRLQALQEGDRR